MDKHNLPIYIAILISLTLLGLYLSPNLLDNVKEKVLVVDKSNSIENSSRNQIVVTSENYLFFEDFEGNLDGWTQSKCLINQNQQTCNIGTVKTPTPVPTHPNWGVVSVKDTVSSFLPCDSNGEVRYEKTFSVPSDGNYQLSVWALPSSCDVCDVFARVFVDETLELQKKGQKRNAGESGVSPSLEETTLHLTSGEHTVEIGMLSTTICFGTFKAQFDNLAISQIENEYLNP